MDKLKPYLFQLRKHHFWVLSVVVVITGPVGWQMATSDLSRIYASQKSKIEGNFAKVQSIISENNPPNETFKAGVDGKTKGLKVDVLEAWRLVYNEQRDKVLQWPAQLGDDFLNYMKDLKPDGDIPLDYRDLYQNYIDTEFPRLLEIVDAKDGRVEDRGRPGIDGPRPAKQDVRVQVGHDYKVIWNPTNQQTIASRLIFQATPTTAQVRATQEDLWVYRALLTIIDKVNADATGHHNAKIKVIDDLSIGGQAAELFLAGVGDGRIMKIEGARAPGGGGLGIPGVEAAAPAAPAGDGRYVDAQGKPLPANQTGPPEFKRMPIHLRLIMDQRSVTELLSECANSPLPVEVRQLRLNNDPKGQRGRGGSGPIRPAIGGQPPGGAGGEGREAADDVNPFEMPVEIHGIIYIFNPPDEKKLGAPPAVGGTDPNAPPVEAPPAQ